MKKRHVNNTAKFKLTLYDRPNEYKRLGSTIYPFIPRAGECLRMKDIYYIHSITNYANVVSLFVENLDDYKSRLKKEELDRDRKHEEEMQRIRKSGKAS